MKKIILAIMAVAIVACNKYTPKVAPIEGTNLSTYTGMVGQMELKGIQHSDGAPVTRPDYYRIAYEGGYVIAETPDNESILFTSKGERLFANLRMKSCSFIPNVVDTLDRFIITTKDGDYWFFPKMKMGKTVGPHKNMSLYPLEEVIVFKDNRLPGILSYDGKVIGVTGEWLVLAEITNRKSAIPVLYVKNGQDWKKFNRKTGADMGEIDNNDIALINSSEYTSVEDVTAVRKKK